MCFVALKNHFPRIFVIFLFWCVVLIKCQEFNTQLKLLCQKNEGKLSTMTMRKLIFITLLKIFFINILNIIFLPDVIIMNWKFLVSFRVFTNDDNEESLNFHYKQFPLTVMPSKKKFFQFYLWTYFPHSQLLHTIERKTRGKAPCKAPNFNKNAEK